MIQNLISMNGYGIFVWLSFSITIIFCTLFYYKTYKTLKKYEKNFATEINRLSASEKKLILSFVLVEIFPTGIPGLYIPPRPDVYTIFSKELCSFATDDNFF